MKCITILLPGLGIGPSGGTKVVYEYANRLVADGYGVNIVFPATLLFGEQNFYHKMKSIARFCYCMLTRRYKPEKWFILDNRIKCYLTWSLNENLVPKSDIYIATSMETSEYLECYKRVLANNKFYFVQGYESWNYGDQRFLKSFSENLRILTISSFLKDIINKEGYKATLIENGFDFSYFSMNLPIKERNKYNISMMYHTQEIKGASDGISALNIVRNMYPQLNATFFGSCKRPSTLPKWITYYQQPTKEIHNKIYNESAIFLGTSHSEGFGLTVGEAMMCGSAVVCTQNGGYAVMSKDNETALTSPIKYPQGLADNIIRLIQDDELRYRIAISGYQHIKKFTWERAYSKFKHAII
jgi:glycosyltransferase involved in cell wall biosynthesis